MNRVFLKIRRMRHFFLHGITRVFLFRNSENAVIEGRSSSRTQGPGSSTNRLMNMPLLGLGTWKIGGTFERDMSHKDVEIQSIQYALSLGYRLIDTAEKYGAGGAEEIVGEAIRNVARDNLYIVSKVWNEHLNYNSVLDATERSLKRLRTPYLDLYLIHWPNPSVPVLETLSAMTELLDADMIRAIGVSNFDVPLLKEALATKITIVANQVEYSIMNRTAESDLIPFCKNNGIQIIAYRPLGRGNLSAAPPALFEIAKKRGATPAQIALSFITAQGIVAIPKASGAAHIEENWGSQKYPLSVEELNRLRT